MYVTCDVSRGWVGMDVVIYSGWLHLTPDSRYLDASECLAPTAGDSLALHDLPHEGPTRLIPQTRRSLSASSKAAKGLLRASSPVEQHLSLAWGFLRLDCVV